MIVIPMAGEGERFKEAGYKRPKPLLPIKGRPLFFHVLMSFSHYFKLKPFLIVVRENEHELISLLNSAAIELGITSFEIVTLKEKTKGQAESVALGLNQVGHQGELIIFNADTIRPGFLLPESQLHKAGYLEVFVGDGEAWSFVLPDVHTGNAIQTAEKRRISNLCSTGLYYFKRSSYFLGAFHEAKSRLLSSLDGGELYVAPLYNELIKCNKTIGYHLIDGSDVLFSGTPEQYEHLSNGLYL